MAFKMKGFTPFTKVNPIDSIKDKFSTVKSAGDNLKSKLADKASDVKAKVKSKATDLKNIAAEKVKQKVTSVKPKENKPNTAAAEKAKSISKKASSKLDKLQTGLTVAGLTPGVGIIPDVANTAISAGRAGLAGLTGDKKGTKRHLINVGINAATAIPVAGQAVAGGKLAVQGIKAGSKLAKGQKALKTAKKVDSFKKINEDSLNKLKPKFNKTGDIVSDTRSKNLT